MKSCGSREDYQSCLRNWNIDKNLSADEFSGREKVGVNVLGGRWCLIMIVV